MGGKIQFMKKLLIFSLMILSFSSFAAKVECGEEVWMNVPGVEDGVFIGKLKASCSISGLVAADIRKLEDHYSAKTEPTVPDSSLGMNGEKFDRTVKSPEGVMTSTIRLASDSKDKLRYVSQSKKIDFTGMSEYIQKLDVDVAVVRTGNESFKVTLINLTHIRKPALAPAGMFSSIAQKKSKKEFRTNLEVLAQEVSDNL